MYHLWLCTPSQCHGTQLLISTFYDIK